MSESFGTFCFYIILKREEAWPSLAERLVPSAFTSFSNTCHSQSLVFVRLVPSAFTSFSNTWSQYINQWFVWYLLLLHHSQTWSCRCSRPLRFGTFCFYIILKLDRLFDAVGNRLVPSAFTSFSNDSTIFMSLLNVWYLLLLHHSQTSIFKNEILIISMKQKAIHII